MYSGTVDARGKVGGDGFGLVTWGPLSLKCLECQGSPNPGDNDVSYSAVSTKRAELTAGWRLAGGEEIRGRMAGVSPLKIVL